MPSPKVSCIMLVNGRERMVERAIKAFEARTYENAELIVYGSTAPSIGLSHHYRADFPIYRFWNTRLFEVSTRPSTIGELRNEANEFATGEIILHMDSDDWSAPQRIETQVQQLISSGVDCVGFNEVLFWREPELEFDKRFGDDGFGEVTEDENSISIECGPLVEVPGSAWRYHNRNPDYGIGGSLCYWRTAWQRTPFEAMPNAKGSTGEDNRFLQQVSSKGYLGFSMVSCGRERFRNAEIEMDVDKVTNTPLLICSVHGGNTATGYADIEANSHTIRPTWFRAAGWDSYCAEAMRLG